VPYAQQNLANSWAMSQQPYQAYNGQQNAAFTDMQNQAFNQASNMGVSPQTYSASNAAQQATNNLLGAQYNPMQLNYGNVTAPQLQQYQMNGPGNVNASHLNNYRMNAAYGQAANTNAAYGQAAQTDAAPYMSASQFNGPQNVGYQGVGTQGFNNRSAAQLMNPYIQQSLNPQEQALAQQQAGQGTQLDAQATRAGAFGGSRAGLQQVAQNAANQNAMSSLIGTGMNNAYNNAQQQFNTQQALGLQAQQSNQQAGVTTGLANQNMAYNTGLQNAQLQQQAGLANQSLAGQYGLQNASMQQQANMANTANQQQANLANQAAQNQFGLSNQTAQNTANQQNLASQLSTQQLGAQQNLAAQQANQQAMLATNQGNLSAALQTQSLGAGQNLTAQQLNQANQMGANQQAIGQQQYGAGLNLATNQGALSGANTLGTLGQNQYGQQVGNIGLLNQLGIQQQQYQQGLLNTQYQNYVNQKNYPYQQAGFFQNMVNGYPVQSGTSTTQPSSPSYLQDAAALGVGAYGVSQMFPNLGSGISTAFGFGANGGLMKSYKKGGMVKRYADQGLTSISSALGPSLTSDPVMLQKEISAAQARGDIQTANALQAELTQQQYITKQAQGLQAAPQAGSYGANPQTAANLAGNGSGQQKMPVPPADTSNSMQGLPSITDLIKMQKDAEKIQHKAAKNPGQMAIADNAAYANAISDAALSNDALPSEPSLPSASGTYKSGGITEVARYADNGVTTSGDSLPADIQKADMGDNSLDLGAPSTLNTVRENRGLSAVPVGQVKQTPQLTQKDIATDPTMQGLPTTPPTNRAETYATGLGALDKFRQGVGAPTPTRYSQNDVNGMLKSAMENYKSAVGASPYESMKTENEKLKTTDREKQMGNAFAAFQAIPGILSGNQAGRGIAQGLSDFSNAYTKLKDSQEKKDQAVTATNLHLAEAARGERLGAYKYADEQVKATLKSSADADKEEFNIYKADRDAAKFEAMLTKPDRPVAVNVHNPNPANEQLANLINYRIQVLKEDPIIAKNAATIQLLGLKAPGMPGATLSNETQLTKVQEERRDIAIENNKKTFNSPIWQHNNKQAYNDYKNQFGDNAASEWAKKQANVTNPITANTNLPQGKNPNSDILPYDVSSKQNPTEAQHAKLKPGEKFYWNGQLLSKGQ
jgi:hypothetical protein